MGWICYMPAQQRVGGKSNIVPAVRKTIAILLNVGPSARRLKRRLRGRVWYWYSLHEARTRDRTRIGSISSIERLLSPRLMVDTRVLSIFTVSMTHSATASLFSGPHRIEHSQQLTFQSLVALQGRISGCCRRKSTVFITCRLGFRDFPIRTSYREE